MTVPADMPHLERVTHRFVDLPSGVRMHVAEAGQGDPVLLVHGFPQHWWEFKDVIGPLSERYRLIAPDYRGAGWTDAPPHGYGPQDITGDLVMLLDALEVDRVKLIAHDWGGYFGFQLCLKHPQRIESYLALNTAHPFLVLDWRLAKILWRFWYQSVIAAPLIGMRAVSDPQQRFLKFLCRWVGGAKGSWPAEDEEIFLGRMRDPARARASVLLYRGFQTREFPRMLRGVYNDLRLTTPTLFLHGTEDAAIQPDFLRGIEPYADDYTLELVDGSGHWIAEHRPDVVVERALDFFARKAPVAL